MTYSTQLYSILKASGWTQEQLAHELKVSFPTLNSWVNQHSQPRQGALRAIQALYFDIVGVDTVDEAELEAAKAVAKKRIITPMAIRDDTTIFNKLTLYLTYHTNTIEGSTMTLSDVEDVIFDHKVLANRTAIEQAEARNHQATLNWLIDGLARMGSQFTINEELILGLHLRLMNGIIADAGQYRTHGVRIMGSRVPLANWHNVASLITSLTSSIELSSNDIISDMARIHAEFEQIHPFSDGNGRTGRLLLLAQALRAGLIPPLVIKERRYAYYKYLEAAQINNDYRPLELFIAQSVETSYRLLS
jgi:Fic family protein